MKDLREWLSQVEAMGELETLRGAHWDLELGTITELVERKLDKPAILFDDIPGYPTGFRVLVNSLGSRSRFALTMGFPQGLSLLEMVQEWRRRPKGLKLLAPKHVDSGPVTENVVEGEEVDLLRFPVPQWHEQDGGRFIGTGDIVITQGPDGGWVNLGTYRAMVHDRNHVGLNFGTGKHGLHHFEEWWATGKPAPVAIAVGMDPLLFRVGATGLPHSIGEYEYAGALGGEPVEVMPGPITGLPIPAGAEIVLEGFVEPGVLRPEGPFGEFMGYYAGGARPFPVVRVDGVCYRNDPIILGVTRLKPPVAGDYYGQVPHVALIWDALEAAGLRDVVGVWSHHYGGSWLVVSLRQRYGGHARQVGGLAGQLPATGVAVRFIVVVDEDIDVTDMDEVLWAMCTRVDPDRDVEILRDRITSALHPLILPERKGSPTLSRVVIDATRPYDWRDRFPEVVASSPELRQQVLGRWGERLRGII